MVYVIFHANGYKNVSVKSFENPEAAQTGMSEKPEGTTTALLVAGPENTSSWTKAQLVGIFNGLDPSAAKVKAFGSLEEGEKSVFERIVNWKPQPAPEPAAEAQEGATEETDMAAKKKTAAKKKPAAKKAATKTATPRKVAPLTVELGTGNAPPKDTTCGCYIRSLVMVGTLTTAEILAKVKKHYPDSTSRPSDVSWNRAKLRAAGKKVPEPVKEEAAKK